MAGDPPKGLPHSHQSPGPPRPMRPVDLKIDFRPDDVLVATFPRSGTTWTVEIVRLLHLRHITRTDHPLRTGEKKKGCFLEMLRRETGSDEIEAMESPRIFKTHVYYDECKFLSTDKNCKIIYVYRDPKDVVCSVFEHANFIGRKKIVGNDIQQLAKNFAQKKEVSRNDGGPADWIDLNEGYMNNPSNYNILYIKYEDLKARTGETISRINDFLGYPTLTKDEEDQVVEASSFDRMKITHNELAGKTVGKTGSYKSQLTQDSVEVLNQSVQELINRIDDSQFRLGLYLRQ